MLESTSRDPTWTYNSEIKSTQLIKAQHINMLISELNKEVTARKNMGDTISFNTATVAANSLIDDEKLLYILNIIQQCNQSDRNKSIVYTTQSNYFGYERWNFSTGFGYFGGCRNHYMCQGQCLKGPNDFPNCLIQSQLANNVCICRMYRTPWGSWLSGCFMNISTIYPYAKDTSAPPTINLIKTGRTTTIIDISSFQTKYQVGELVSDEGILAIEALIEFLGSICMCQCNYSCSCNCAYCSCNCDHCNCNCAYCSCNCAYSGD